MRLIRPFGASLDEFLARKLDRLLSRRGWHKEVLGFVGYGTQHRIRVLARVVRAPAKRQATWSGIVRRMVQRRGWRIFLEIPVPGVSVVVRTDNAEAHTQTDTGGFVDIDIDGNFKPGWHDVEIQAGRAPIARAQVLVIADNQEFGIISDIDDTIIKSFLPRIMLATWNNVFSTELARKAVPGMARMYQRFQKAHPGAPIFYVSSGTWSSLGFVRRFMKRHGFPPGPVLLTDWGVSNTGYFRVGRDHKRRTFGELVRDFPKIRWLLVGDNGQHDPVLYRELAELHPNRVRGILIRRLSASEQVLVHGTSGVLPETGTVNRARPPVPEATGDDGDDLYYWMCSILGEEPH
jgi:phosphatidate phosphatase APP1